MTQITPAPINQSPDFVPADGMEQTNSPREKWLLFLIGIVGLYAVFTLGAWSQKRSPQPPPTGPYSDVPTVSKRKLWVHVAGAVRSPGVYQLPADARVYDAVKRAVPLPDADTDALNLAAWAEDGSRIEVPFKVNEAKSSASVAIPEASTPRSFIQSTPQQGEPKPSSKTAKTETSKASTKKASPTPPKAAKTAKMPPRPVNINRASLDELTLLPGVGPAIAERIIEYRKENGAFSSIDDLDEVKGIGEKKLEKMRPYITLR